MPRLASCWWLCGLFPVGIAAQAPPDNGDKSVEIVRADAGPVIDGVLDETVWSQAVLIEDLHQTQPFEYDDPSQPTEIRLFFDDEALYIAARLWESDAGDVTAQVLRQGEDFGNDDLFAIILDPYLNRRSGYRFQVNPNGVRWDALYQNTSNLENNWEGIWQGAATRNERGWTAEMAIPFKTLSFNPNAEEWGINFERRIQHNNETLGWVSRNRQLNPGVAGTAVGFSDLEQGMGLDIVPSVSVTGAKVYGATASTDSNLEPSLDVFYKITPSLNGALTLNTDFSSTEVDDRQVNLTRFSLFFPEKRDFFLQDADIFEFGRIGGQRGFGGGGGGGGNPSIPSSARQNGRPFFSRNIGLSRTGQPVDIEYGGKLSGRVGRWNVGALAILQDEFEDVEATDIFVGRLSANVLEESAVGIIVTDGDPQSNLDSTLAGTDFRYRNTRLPGGRVLESEIWYQQTDTEGIDGDDRAYGFGVSSPNNTGWRGGFKTASIESNFDPAVGFVNRTGIRDYALDFGYRERFRDRFIQSVYGGVDSYRVESLETGRVESEVLALRFTMSSATQDNLYSRYIHNREVLHDNFVIYRASDGSRQVVVPPGDYSFREVRIGGRTGGQRKVSANFGVTAGEFYDGDHVNTNVGLTWRHSERFSLNLGYRVDDIELPQGDFAVRVSSLTTQIVFSSRLSWVNLIQYDNISETLGFNSRLHWIPEAGREGYIVLNHSLANRDKNRSFHSTNADLALKFNYTWRY